MRLGDRMKRYERVSDHQATPRMPLMIRVDGKTFHTFTRNMERPYDGRLRDCMVSAAVRTAREMQGFKVGYVQSDEVTFCLTDYDRVESQGWFGYDLQKIVSISAAMMTAHFIDEFYTQDDTRPGVLPVFDSRAFSVPASDVANNFLWRAKDWERNSLQMFARAHFSHKEVKGKNHAAIHDMLHEKGLNWATDTTPRQRNGTFIVKREGAMDILEEVLPTYPSIASIVDPHVCTSPENL